MRLINITISLVILLSCGRQKNQVNVLFDNVEGLEEGSDVYYNGLVVGNVSKLSLDDEGVLANIYLQDSLRIPVGSNFIINPSILGSAHITIEPSVAKEYLTIEDTALGRLQKEHIYDDWTLDTTKQKKIRESFQKIGDGIKGLIEASKTDSIQSSK